VCCTSQPALTKRLRARKKNIVVYKRLTWRGEGPHRKEYQYKQGLNVPVEPLYVPQSYEENIRAGALHVSRTRKKATRLHGSYVVRCVVRPKDVLGANDRNLAVSRLYITKAEWRRVFGPGGPCA
jgi:hypothetical protein